MKQRVALKTIMSSLIVSMLLCNCSTTKSVTLELPTYTLPASKLAGGSSGMAKLSEQKYIVVYDFKNFEDGVRIAVIENYPDSFAVRPISITDWKDEDGRPSDLESICSIPNKPLEYLAAESGSWQGKFGRIFHIKIDTFNYSTSVLGVFKLPRNVINDLDTVGDQNEGIMCIQNEDGDHVLYLGERGGSASFPSGVLTWCTINFADYRLEYSTLGKIGIPIAAPGKWIDIESKRDIADLYLDESMTLWSVASEDQGDSGPFNSAIYQVGQFKKNKKGKLIFQSEVKLERTIPGFKIEALSSPGKYAKGSKFSIGTEDELYGGVWRSIN